MGHYAAAMAAREVLRDPQAADANDEFEDTREGELRRYVICVVGAVSVRH